MSNQNANAVNDVVDAAVAAVAAVAAAVPKRKGRPLKPDSKLGQARALFNAATDRTRPAMIAAFTTNITGVSKPIASAYYHLLVKNG
jgi:hypothetical protein